jgi:periplasmic protein TonB
MSTDSPPGSPRPADGGEFTWPPTSEELEAIQVIPFDDPSSVKQIAIPNVMAVAPAIKPAIKGGRRWQWRPPGRDDLVLAGVTLTSVLAITTAAFLQFSEKPSAPAVLAAPSDPPIAPLDTLALPGTSSIVAAAPLAPLAQDASPTPIASRKVVAHARRAPRIAERRRVAAPARSMRLSQGTSRAAAPRVASLTTSREAGYTRPRLISPEDHVRRGKLVLWVEVRKNGKVGDVDVLSSDLDRSQRSQRDLQRAAISNVKKWRYTPAMRDGEPTETRVRVVVDINLDSSRVVHTTAADARRMGAAANRVADSVRAAR